MSAASKHIEFLILSFEGPDRYARAGGLGVRVTHLAEALAEKGYETHLLFIGDPSLPASEELCDGRLKLWRWCQWISQFHPVGVYDGEEQKLNDFNASVPRFAIEEVIRPALAGGRLPVILAEEWQTSGTVTQIHDLLIREGLRDRVVLMWNANNTTSFNRVNWGRLRESVQVTTVSRYMKHLMWDRGLNPLVIPNGIPGRLLEPVNPADVATLHHLLQTDDHTVLLFKAGRFDPAKRWLMAVEAAAMIKRLGYKLIFPLRGGVEAHGAEVLSRASALGLTITDVCNQPDSILDLFALLQGSPEADIYNIRFDLSQDMLRLFYAASDAVLANSGHEPFGLVGLEAMAAGGVVFAGATGEEYLIACEGGIVLDTDLPEEIVSEVTSLKANPRKIERVRKCARKRAAAYTWNNATDILIDKVRFVARATGVELIRSTGTPRRKWRQYAVT